MGFHFLVSLSVCARSSWMGFSLVQYLQTAAIFLAVKLVVTQSTSTQGEKVHVCCEWIVLNLCH